MLAYGEMPGRWLWWLRFEILEGHLFHWKPTNVCWKSMVWKLEDGIFSYCGVMKIPTRNKPEWLWGPTLKGLRSPRPSWALVPNRAWHLAGEKLPSAHWRTRRSAEPMRQMRGNRRWVFGVFLRICNWCSCFSLRCGFNDDLQLITAWLI